MSLDQAGKSGEVRERRKKKTITKKSKKREKRRQTGGVFFWAAVRGFLWGGGAMFHPNSHRLVQIFPRFCITHFLPHGFSLENEYTS